MKPFRLALIFALGLAAVVATPWELAARRPGAADTAGAAATGGRVAGAPDDGAIDRADHGL